MGFILFLTGLPSVVFGWGRVLFLRLIGAVHSLRWEPTLVLTAIRSEKRKLFKNYSFAFGRSIIYLPERRASPGNPWTRTQDHEHVHIRQGEDENLTFLVIGAFVIWFTSSWTLGLLIWAFGSDVGWMCRCLAACLRGGNFYRDCEHERSAYAQTDRSQSTGTSWLMRNLTRRRQAENETAPPNP